MEALEDSAGDTCPAVCASVLSGTASAAHDRIHSNANVKGRCTMSSGGVLAKTSRTSTIYNARISICHAELYALGRKELAHAIADNIALVAMKQKVLNVGLAEMYGERLPRAIKDVGDEQDFDLDRLRISFRISIWG
eukprot:5940062-Amphidinium_carterae.1